MDRDLRHGDDDGVSMDDVLASVRKTFVEQDDTPAKPLRPKLVGQLPVSVLAQQRRIEQALPKPKVLPPLPTVLSKRDQETAPLRTEPFPSRLPRRMVAEVPDTVAVDSTQPELLPPAVKPKYQWGDRRARIRQAARESLSVELPLTANMVRKSAPVLEPQAEGFRLFGKPKIIAKDAVTAEDWNTLKADLHRALDKWVEKQKHG